MVHFQTLLCFLAVLRLITAFWRMPCANYPGVFRLDAIVAPRAMSSHGHSLAGSWGLSPNATYSALVGAPNTSCAVAQDHSGYWAPPLMFMYNNGTVVSAPQVSFLAYYLLNPRGENITAFPAGFQMLAGDANQRNFTQPVPDAPPYLADNSQFNITQRSIGFNCLNYALPPEGSLYRHFLPTKDYLTKNCVDGLRLELLFPNCWNGKDLDSPNHKSHVAYSPGAMGTGDCPAGYPVRLPTLFFETIFAVKPFENESGQFVLANGDPTGFGYHGDYMAGWDVPLLQNAVNTCTNLSGAIEDCPIFEIREDYPQYNPPKLRLGESLYEDNCAGPRHGLCGNVKIQYGPAYATPGTTNASEAYNPQSTVFETSSIPATPILPNLSYSPGTDMAPSAPTEAESVIRVTVTETSTTTATATTTMLHITTTAATTLNPEDLYNGEQLTYSSDGTVVLEIIHFSTSTKYVVAVPTTHQRKHRHAHEHQRHRLHR